MNKAMLAGAAFAGALLAAPSAFAFKYEALCPSWEYRGPILFAYCYTGQGGRTAPTSLDVRSCEPGTDITNQFGRLVCEVPRGSYGYPPPGYGGYAPPPPPYGGWRHSPRGPNWD
jgi:hypothetical protein